MKRLYADFNDIAENGTLPLTCKGSIDSIAATDGQLHSGEDVMLSDGQREVVARVFKLDDGSWQARSDWSFIDVSPSCSG
ncbi:MAG: hypothetical protein K1X88_24980 [Nannocystaceae bacterium]|nr:hypothetical protein [Nannocystaceae bacterium]